MSAQDDDDQPCEEADYRVGYRRPPRHTQFKKGKSGNPRGRNKGALGASTLLNKALNERITITENGRTRKVLKREAAYLSLIAKALKGDVRALDILIKLIQHESDRRGHDLPQITRIENIIVDPKLRDEEWDQKYGAGQKTDVPREELHRMTGQQVEKLIKMHGAGLTFNDDPYWPH